MELLGSTEDEEWDKNGGTLGKKRLSGVSVFDGETLILSGYRRRREQNLMCRYDPGMSEEVVDRRSEGHGVHKEKERFHVGILGP